MQIIDESCRKKSPPSEPGGLPSDNVVFLII